MRFKSHPRNQEAVPKKMPPRKLEVSSSFLRFSPFFSYFQKFNINANKKMTLPFSKYREGLEPYLALLRGIFGEYFSLNMPLFVFYKC